MSMIEKLPDARGVSAEEEGAHLDELLDEALEETFPASDPISLHVERRIETARAAQDVPREPPSDS
jgi:hypothetical protein